MAHDPQTESSKVKREPNVTRDQFIASILRGGEEGLLDTVDGMDFDQDNLDDLVVDGDDDDDEDDDIPGWDAADAFIDDDEITNLLNQTKERRLQAKSGSLKEAAEQFQNFEDELIVTSGIGKVRHRNRRSVLAGEARIPEEARTRLGEANSLYINKNFGAAIDLLQEVITEFPNVYQAWNTLGLVHEELGNTDKSLQLRMVAAHMCQDDAALWKELGLKSIENDAIQQAIYCLSKALTLNPTDVDTLWDRACLYRKLGKTTEAIDGFQQILDIVPHHFKVINELAQLYRTKGQTTEAIELYEKAIEYHQINEKVEEEEEEEEEEDEEDDFKDKLGYAEINMLSELYLMLNEYRRCLDCMKTGVRYVQHRQHETWWFDNDDEKDDEYLKEDDEEAASDRLEFPIELRVRMGVCRLYLGQVDIATKHFNYLLQYPATAYPDLHQDIAYAYMDKRHYDLALSVFQKIIDVSDEVEVDLLIRTAECYHEAGDLDTAAIFYVNVLDEQRENLDVMMALASVYEEQGKEDRALELVEFVMKKHQEARRQKKTAEEKSAAESSEGGPSSDKPGRLTQKASLFDEAKNQTRTERYRKLREQRLAEDEMKELQARNLFMKAEELEGLIGNNVANADRHLMREFMRIAQELWEDFNHTRAFYPSVRERRFEGFYAVRRGRRQRSSTGFEAHQMASRLRDRIKREDGGVVEIINEEEDEQLRDEEERELQMTEANHFRQIPFVNWLRVFIKYAIMLTATRRSENAYDLLKRVCEANVFYHDVTKKTSIKAALMCCGLISGNYHIVNEACRWFSNFYQFKSEPYRLYCTAYSSGIQDMHAFIAQSNMKYYVRNILLMDAVVARERVLAGDKDSVVGLEEIKQLKAVILAMNVDPSAADEQNYKRYYHVPAHLDVKAQKIMGIENPKRVNPVLLTLFGHFNSLSRNYVSAALFYMRSYALSPKDPLNTLSLGISLLQCAMQRKTDNRHLQIMQGMMFLFEYRKLRGPNQETEYNLGRAFHLLGLTHLAVPHYERALCLPSAAKQGKVAEKDIKDVYKWPVEHEDVDEKEDSSDLTWETAYNLHSIYITSGSPNLAQIVLLKYCTI
ncbi:uncharacterized protein BYT42DRAFT_551117 [Radiomyces spectabilis]|uniref:uncharacterized protein n=1 Tax=Radiomyces spectabilis TaxID=64574 RepID=UPI00222079CE|nr:uncharacterized protein BYT42DRAFT_551117 [Radiomyces spectabilis]KAI8393461.1 hypothetical protein BYT42DRAFT_551117 [Radiomyces spectabilis]